MELKDGVPHLNVTIDDINKQVGLIVDAIRPHWKKADVKIEERSSGYINRNYYCHTTDEDDAIFVRIVNSRMPGQLDSATNAMRYLRHVKLGAQLLLTFDNGLVMEFIEGEVVTWHDIAKVKEPKVWLNYAREMAKFHSMTDFEAARKYSIPTHGKRDLQFRALIGGVIAKGTIPAEELSKLPTVDEILEWSDVPYQQLVQAGAEMVFCHSDSNPTNIIIRPDKSVAIVDYDECTMDLAVYEMAKSFTSLAGLPDFKTEDMPTDEQQNAFVKQYLETRREYDPRRGEVTAKQVQNWRIMLRKAQLCGMLRGVGAVILIQEVGNKDMDFNLAHRIYKLYLERKDAILAETLIE